MGTWHAYTTVWSIRRFTVSNWKDELKQAFESQPENTRKAAEQRAADEEKVAQRRPEVEKFYGSVVMPAFEEIKDAVETASRETSPREVRFRSIGDYETTHYDAHLQTYRVDRKSGIASSEVAFSVGVKVKPDGVEPYFAVTGAPNLPSTSHRKFPFVKRLENYTPQDIIDVFMKHYKLVAVAPD